MGGCRVEKEEEKKDLVKELEQYLAKNDLMQVKNFLNQFQAVDIAEIVENLELVEHQFQVISLLINEKVALVLNEMETELVIKLLSCFDLKRATKILEEMPADEATDFLGELSDKEQTRYLQMMGKEDRAEVRELLTYPEDTAGGIMTTEYVAVNENITVVKAIDILRETAPDAETIYYVFVVNALNHLVGVISLRELIVASTEAIIKDIMKSNVVSVPVDMDQEEVAQIVTKYNFLAIPVIEHDNSLLGIVTVDDVIDVIHEEATEDMYRLAGALGEEDEDDSFLRRIVASLRTRLPWLFVTMVGGLLSGQVLSSFSEQLNAVVALAFFIPLLTGMGGNVGTQSSTITVRGIATNQIKDDQVCKVVVREAIVGLMIGAILGFIVGSVASWWLKKPMLGVVVGLAMMGNMITASTMGTLVPIAFKKIGIDPAVASAPFISTVVDITGLLIYSTLATLLIKSLI